MNSEELLKIKSINEGYEFVQGLLTAFFLLAVIVVLYTRLFLGVDFEHWDIQKCNPKYIFYSGYIKKNPNSSALKSTSDNFKECIARFNNQKDSEFSKVLERSRLEQYQTSEELVNNHKMLSKERILNLQRKVNNKNKQFQLQIENIKQSSTVGQVQHEIDKLNRIVEDVKEYAHSYLTYAMMHFVFKHKISEENGTLTEDLDPTVDCNSMSGISGKTNCKSNLYCNYNQFTEECNNKQKGEFYKEQVNSLNETIKKYFGNNKL